MRALIHQANLTPDQGLAAVPKAAIAEHRRLFRHGQPARERHLPSDSNATYHDLGPATTTHAPADSTANAT